MLFFASCLCPALNEGGNYFSLCLNRSFYCCETDQWSLIAKLLFSFAFAPRTTTNDLNYAQVAQIGRDVNSRQIQIDSFHLPRSRQPWLPDWHCKSDKEGKKEKKGERERGESFVQSTVQFSSTLPLFNR